MLTLTLELIRDNPWNAVNLMLPKKMDKMLLKAALAATAYCRASEFAFAVAANGGRYEQPGWRESASRFWDEPWSTCFAEEVEARWQDASSRYLKLLALQKGVYEPEPAQKEEAYL